MRATNRSADILVVRSRGERQRLYGCRLALLQFLNRAGTDALVTVSLGVHGVHFSPDFGYTGWTGLKTAQ